MPGYWRLGREPSPRTWPGGPGRRVREDAGRRPRAGRPGGGGGRQEAAGAAGGRRRRAVPVKHCELFSPDDFGWQSFRVKQEKRARPFGVIFKISPNERVLSPASPRKT